MNPQTAALAYRASAQLAQNARSVAALLHENVEQALRSAIFAYEQKAPDKFCREIARAHKILGGLLAHMNFDAAGIAGLKLRQLYLNLARMLVCIGNDSEPVEKLRRAADIFQILHAGDDGEIDVINLYSA